MGIREGLSAVGEIGRSHLLSRRSSCWAAADLGLQGAMPTHNPSYRRTVPVLLDGSFLIHWIGLTSATLPGLRLVLHRASQPVIPLGRSVGGGEATILTQPRRGTHHLQKPLYMFFVAKSRGLATISQSARQLMRWAAGAPVAGAGARGGAGCGRRRGTRGEWCLRAAPRPAPRWLRPAPH